MIRSRVNNNELFPTGDWRYLLPTPAPTTVAAVGGGWAPSTARQLWPDRTPTADTSSGDNQGPAGNEVDLVVADSFSPATLDRVHALIAPDGLAYIEAPWSRSIPPVRVARRLRRRGFEVGALYSISPGRHRWAASWWIPVDSVAAVRLVAGTLKPATRPSGRAGELMRRGPAELASRWPRLVAKNPWLLHPTRPHRLGVIARPNGSLSTDPRTEKRFLPGLRPASAELVSDVVMRIGGSSTDQAVLFHFAGSAEPGAVIKAPTRCEEITASGHESKILHHLTSEPDPLDSVPVPVSVEGSHGFDAWGQAYASGHDMTKLVSSDNLANHVSAVTAWLVRLADKTARAPTSAFVTSLEHDLRRLGQGLRTLPDGRDLERTVIDAWHRVGTVEAVCRHRDLGPWNIRVDDEGALTIIDWADSTMTGLPMCDLVHFIAHLCLCAHDGYRPERQTGVIAGLMDPDSEPGRLLVEYTGRYAVEVGITDVAIDDLRILTWALDLLRRPSLERGESLYLELLRAELRRIRSRP